MPKANKNRYGELVSNTLIFAFASIGSRFIMFLLLPLYTNQLSTSEYGTVELIMTGVNLLTPILTLSISDAITRFGLDKNIPHDSVLKTSSVFLLIASILMIGLTPVFSLYTPIAEYVCLFTFTMIVNMFRSAYTFYLKAIDKNIFFAIDTIIYTLVLAVLNIILLAVCHEGVNGYLWSTIIASCISILFCGIVGDAYSAIIRTKFDVQLLRRMLMYSTPMVLNAISWWITHSSDKYMLEYFHSSSDVGIYSAASKIPSLLSVVNTLFSQAWTISSIKEFDSTADKKFYSNIFRVFCLCMLGASACILLIVKPFMSIYIGPSFIESWLYVPVLLIAALFNSCSGFFGSIYIATRNNIRCTISTVICGITNIILNFMLIPKYGIMGASIATAVAYIVVAIYRMLDCQKIFYFKINYLKHGCAALLVCVQSNVVTVSNYRYLFSSVVIISLAILYKEELSIILNKGLYFLNGRK